MGIRLDKVSQLVVHFACSIPLRPELKATERESLKIMLQEHDSEMFQLFNVSAAASAGPEPILYQAARQYPLGSAMVTAPSFVMAPSSIGLLALAKLGDTYMFPSRTLECNELNKRMRETLFKVQDIVKGIKFTRAGKIFELVLGPLGAPEKDKLLKKLFPAPERDIGELRLLFTRHIESNSRLYNVRTELQYQQMKLDDPIQVAIKVDINNRNLESSLEPRDVEAIWKEADALISPHLEQLVGENA